MFYVIDMNVSQYFLPMDKSPLGIHKIKLMIQSSPGLSNGCGVAQHADSTLDLGQVTSWDNSGRLVVDAHLNVIKAEQF